MYARSWSLEVWKNGIIEKLVWNVRNWSLFENVVLLKNWFEMQKVGLYKSLKNGIIKKLVWNVRSWFLEVWKCCIIKKWSEMSEVGL